MNIKKSIVAIATSLITIASLGSLAASAYSTIPYVPYTIYTDVTTYSGKYTGSYGSFYARPNDSAVASSVPGYSSSYKYAYYAQYKEVNGIYQFYRDSVGSSTDTALTPPLLVDSSVAYRYHAGSISNTSDPNSSPRESYVVHVYKQ